MRCAILAFTAGVLALQSAAVLPSAPVMCVCVACAIACIALERIVKRFWSTACFTACAGTLLGYTWAALIAHHALASQLAPADEGHDLTVIGIVDSLPYRFEQGLRFNLRVERTETPATAVPPRIALSWYADRGSGAGSLPDSLKPGERWRLTVRLQRPHGNANPGGFDYEAWLLEQGVRATGYVRVDSGNAQLDAFVPRIGTLIERTRAALRDRIQAALPDRQYAGVIVALVIGDQRGIDQADWQVFNRTGIGHLISISGLHITMIAGLAALAMASLWRRSFFTGARLPLLLPAQKVAALTGAVAALLYVLLAGFGVPAQRTLYMLVVVALALWFGRLASVTHVLCLALGVVVLFDPWAVLWPGFWLSFGAVAVILFGGHGRIARRETGFRANLKAAWRTQWSVTLGLVPLTMLLFGQISLVSPLANAIAIPLVSFIVTPLALLGSLAPAPLGGWLLLAAHAAVEGLAFVLGQLAQMPAAVWRAPAPPAWVFLLALGGTLWMLMPRGWPHRWAGAAAWLPLLLQMPEHPEPGRFRVIAFDAGQGMALLIETAGHRLLYDTGPGYAPGADAGSRVLLPYLRMRGIADLDGMVVSHSDADHTGGALAVLGETKVGWLASSLPASHPVARAASRHLHCAAGQRWEWDGVRFEMLHPAAASYADPKPKPNARSCTLRIGNGRTAILLAGDIEAAQEAALVSNSADGLRADVLLAPHHGSGTSSTQAFLQAVHPSVSVFQVGWRNRYRHPKKEVYERYGELGIERLRTDELGALTLAFGETVEAQAYRRQHARYWSPAPQ
ncbi:DNA internalization-related competence protein ComEC/Rec2 [Massilia aerilata]|uniref:DNA internalization-related competence protein ComEC/Rec2 n=1 Tax=Massilia aerilata TaxID=453817 RepID=A0ABW0RT96_9BURK